MCLLSLHVTSQKVLFHCVDIKLVFIISLHLHFYFNEKKISKKILTERKLTIVWLLTSWPDVFSLECEPGSFPTEWKYSSVILEQNF